MLMIALKLLLGLACVGLGVWLWRRADRWNEQGVIPKDAVEARQPRRWLRSDRGFGAAIAWERMMAILAWAFAALFMASIILELAGFLP